MIDDAFSNAGAGVIVPRATRPPRFYEPGLNV
jgi:hypothetical protein